MPPTPSVRCDSPSFKIALALSLIRFNKIHRPSPSFSSDAQRWKRKAKDRKLEILRLREELKQLEAFGSENEIEQLGTSVDFLVEFTDNILVKGEIGPSFATFSHQAIDFILASLKNLLSSQKDIELIEDIVNGLIMRLIRRMCAIPENDVSGSVNSDSDPQFCVQHLIRKLGNEPFVGQRILLSVSQKTSVVIDSLLLMDPFDDSFPCLHGNMFMMIELMEFLISDYVRSWISIEDFDARLLEEWVRSVIQARKASELMESRNGLYMLYMERVVGELAKILSPLASQGKLDVDILSYMCC